MATEIITTEDLQEFKHELLEEIGSLIKKNPEYNPKSG